jgi:hypothetical protein
MTPADKINPAANSILAPYGWMDELEDALIDLCQTNGRVFNSFARRRLAVRETLSQTDAKPSKLELIALRFSAKKVYD